MCTTLLLALLPFAGCSGSTHNSMFGTDMDALRDVVSDHFDRMTGMGSFDGVATEESDYGAAFDDVMTDMGTSMDSMMGCMGMMEGDDDGMDDMHDHMDAMKIERESHDDMQSTCSDMEDCKGAEPSHRDGMMTHLHAMDSWMDGGGGGTDCGSDGMGM